MAEAVVVGYGSIGQRHARLLDQLACNVAVVSRREIDFSPRFPSIADALSARKVDYVVIATETSQHEVAVHDLLAAKFSGRLLIEKPLGSLSERFRNLPFASIGVGYNLRFHPALAELHKATREQKLISIQIYCGQYLPTWRPDSDYRDSYSADPAKEGGVLRDLSHEIDYLLWLGGAWKRVAAIGGKFGLLEIKSDDCWAILAETDECPASTVQINYLDRPGRRQVIVNTVKHTYVADLVRATLERDGEVQQFKCETDDMYLDQHRAMLAGDTSRVCSLAEGQSVMQFIEAAERSVREHGWISS